MTESKQRKARPEEARAGADPNLVAVEGGVLSVAEACALSRLSKAELYNRMKDGKLKYCQYGKRRLVIRQSLLELLAAHVAG